MVNQRLSELTPFIAGILSNQAKLKRYAVSLTHDRDRADDLVQQTVEKALLGRDSFQEGTNQSAWMRVIMRNQFYSNFRTTRHEMEDPEEKLASLLTCSARQLHGLYVEKVQYYLNSLPPHYREALLLVCANEASYEEVALQLSVPIGTIKSRVHRARIALVELLQERDAYSAATPT